jgi:hypothetical protein
MLCAFASLLITTQASAGQVHTAILQNTSLKATFRSGILCELTNLHTGVSLALQSQQTDISKLNLFGDGQLYDLTSAKISSSESSDRLLYIYSFPDSTILKVDWKLDRTGDMVLHMSARSPKPVHQIRAALFGLDISRHKLVTVTNFGIGTVIRAPYTDKADVSTDESVDWPDYYYVQPLVALFEGSMGGFFIEGRCKDIGPARVVALGNGKTTDLVFSKLYAQASYKLDMYEIRIRSYAGNWYKAADPFVKWMEYGQGFVPLDRQHPKWIRDISGQTYNDPQWDPAGATKKLDDIAKVLAPSKTILGKTSEWRLPKWGFDQGWGDYSFSDDVRAYFKRAKEIGFHTAVHFNSSGIYLGFKDLITRFEPGLRPKGTNPDGTVKYYGYNGEWGNGHGPVTFVWCSHAYQPFNDFMMEWIDKVVEAGVDIIYLDEAMTPTGRFLVNGKTSIQGSMDFMKQIRTRHPNVAVMTEQFNPMCKYAAFALTSHDLGHPLSGYLTRKFTKVINGYGQYELSDPKALESYWSWQGDRIPGWGDIVPGWGGREIWENITKTFQKYDLKIAPEIPLKPNQLSAYKGRNGVTAFYEKTPQGMELVVKP